MAHRLLNRIVMNVQSYMLRDQLAPPRSDDRDDNDHDGDNAEGALLDGDVPPLEQSTAYLQHGPRRGIEAAAAALISEGFTVTTVANEKGEDWRRAVDRAIGPHATVDDFVQALAQSPAAIAFDPRHAHHARLVAADPAVSGSAVPDTAVDGQPTVQKTLDALVAATGLGPITAGTDDAMLALIDDVAWLARLRASEPDAAPKDADDKAAPAELKALSSVQTLRELASALAAPQLGKNASLAATYVLSKAAKCAMGSATATDLLAAAAAAILTAGAVASAAPDTRQASSLAAAFTDGVVRGVQKIAQLEGGANDAAAVTSATGRGVITIKAIVKDDPKKKKKPTAATTAATTTLPAAPAGDSTATAAATPAAAATESATTATTATPAPAADQPIDDATAQAIQEAQNELDAQSEGDAENSENEDASSDGEEDTPAAAERRRRRDRRRRKKEEEAKTPPQWRIPVFVSPLATEVTIKAVALSEAKVTVVRGGTQTCDREGAVASVRRGESHTVTLPATARGRTEGRAHTLYLSGTAATASIEVSVAIPNAPASDAAARKACRNACGLLIAAIFGLRLDAGAQGIPTLQGRELQLAADAKKDETETATNDEAKPAEPEPAADNADETDAAAATAADVDQELQIAPLLRGGLNGGAASGDAAQQQQHHQLQALLEGTADDAVAAKFKMVYARAFVRNDAMQQCLRAAVAVCMRHCASFDEAANEVVRQWFVTMGPALQGEIGAPMRLRLVELAKWIISDVAAHSDATAVGAKAALDHLRALLGGNVPIAELKATLQRREKAAASIPAVGDAVAAMIESKDDAAFAEAVATRVAATLARSCEASSLDALADGASPATAKKCRDAVARLMQHFISKCPDTSVASLITRQLAAHAWSPAMASATGSAVPSMIDGAVAVAERMCKNAKNAASQEPVERDVAARFRIAGSLHFSSNRQGFNVNRTSAGATVDVAGQGTHAVRSASAWPVKYEAGGSSFPFFEASVDSTHKSSVKRVMVGFADPLANVSSFAAVHKANTKYRVIGLDSSCIVDPKFFLMPFGAGDVIGCGIDTETQTVVFTLNGAAIAQKTVEDKEEFSAGDGGIAAGSAVRGNKARSVTALVPFVLFESTDRCSVSINMGGGTGFAFDPRPSPDVRRHVTNDAVDDAQLRAVCDIARQLDGSAEAAALRNALVAAGGKMIAAVERASAVADGDDPVLLRIAAIATSLVELIAGQSATSKDTIGLFADQLIAAAAAATGMVQALLLGAVADLTTAHGSVADPRSDSLSQLAIPAALPDKRATKPQTVPFEPVWEATPRDDAVAISGSFAQLNKKQHIGHLLGTPLPRRGTTTFSVMIQSKDPQVGEVIGFGQFYIGVASAPIAKLGGLEWKAAEPPCVWALHSNMGAQLGHANVSVFGLDPFLFSTGTVLTVCVDRDRGTVSFSRGSRHFIDVFTGVPMDAEVCPFVQIVAEYTSATIVTGTREQPVTAPTVRARNAVRVSRRLLTLRGAADRVADATCADLEAVPAADDAKTGMKARRHTRALSTLGALPDAAASLYRWPGGRATCIVERVVGASTLIRVAVGSDWAPLVVPTSAVFPAARHVALPALRVPPPPPAGNDAAMAAALSYDDPFGSDSDDGMDGGMTRTGTTFFGAGGDDEKLLAAGGLQRCIDTACRQIARWCDREITIAELTKAEDEGRAAIAQLAAAEWNGLGGDVRTEQFVRLAKKNAGMAGTLLQAPAAQRAPTFSVQHSSPSAEFPEHYRGHLMITPEGHSAAGPWTGVANEAIPTSGVINIRVYVDAEWRGMLPGFLGISFRGSGFVGLCTDAYHGATRRHAARDVADPDMWAVPFRDTPANHMKHCKEVARNYTVIPAKSIVRLHVNRTRGTMEVFVGNSRGEAETSLGVLFDQLPVGVPLYPFVELPGKGACAIFLPDAAPLRRPIVNSVRYAHLINDTKSHNRHLCDGCVNDLADNALDMPHWFRCNSCADIDLCLNCFSNHVHPGHTFTQLTPQSFVASPLERGLNRNKNAAVEIPAALVTPMASRGFVFDEASFDTKATVLRSAGTAAAVWGVLRKETDTAVTEVTCTVSWQTRIAHAPRVVVGICPAADLPADRTAADALLQLPTTAPSKEGRVPAVAVATHRAFVPEGAIPTPSRRGTGRITKGEAVTFVITSSSVECLLAGTPIWRVRRSLWAAEKLVCFVGAEGAAGLTVDFCPRASTEYITAKILEESPAHEVRVGSNAAYRWLPPTSVRTPLTACKSINQLKVGSAVFLADITANKFLPCVVDTIDPSKDAPITVNDGEKTMDVGLSSLFMSEVDAKANEEKAEEVSMIDPMELQKMRMRRFYSAYAPEKNDADIDKALAAYSKMQGGLEKMWEALVRKYGPEPEEAANFVADVRYMKRKAAAAPLNAQDAFTISRLLRFVSEHVSGKSSVSALPHVHSLAPALVRLSGTIPVLHVDATATDALLALVDAPESTFSGAAISGRHLDAAYTTIDDVESTTATATDGTTSSSLAEPWWTTAEKSGALPAFAEGTQQAALMAGTPQVAWSGELVTQSAFALPLSVDFKTGTASIGVPGAIRRDCPEAGPIEEPLLLAVGEVNVDRAVGFATVTLCFGEPASTKRDAQLARISAVGHSAQSKKAQPCPSTVAAHPEPVALVARLYATGEGDVAVRWGTPDGVTGTGSLAPDAEDGLAAATVAFKPFPTITDASSQPSKRNSSSKTSTRKKTVSAQQRLLARLGLDLHLQMLATAIDAPLPAAAELFEELGRLRRTHATPSDATRRVAAMLHSVNAKSPEIYASLLRVALAVAEKANAHDDRIARNEAKTAAALLGVALDCDSAAFDLSQDSCFWPAFAAVVRVAHIRPSQSQMSVVKAFAAKRPHAAATRALLVRLQHHFDAQHRAGVQSRALCAAADTFSEVFSNSSSSSSSLPIREVAIIIDAASALASQEPLPQAVDADQAGLEAASFQWLPVASSFKPGEMRGDQLIKGRVRGSVAFSSSKDATATLKRAYFEVKLPASARLIIGAGTAAHGENKSALGEDAHSIGFDGASLFRDVDCTRFGWALARARCAMGCLIDAEARHIIFSVDAESFTPVPFPANWAGDEPVFAYVQVSATTSGAEMRSTEESCRFLPPRTEAVRSAQPSAVAMAYDAAKRSTLPTMPLDKYIAIAQHMSDPDKNALPDSMIAAAAEPYKRHIEAVQRCLLAAWPLVDPSDSNSRAGAAVSVLKRVVTRQFREEHLCVVPPVQERKDRRSLPQITVRWFDLFAKRDRTPIEALQKSVLGQLHRQIGNDRSYFKNTPMFMASLMMTDSGHVPIDAGGPYNQVWSLLSEEIMTDAAAAKPGFHRNPLFRFVTNSNGTFVVPDRARSSPFELGHFRLLGRIMGHMVRAKTVLAFEISPFVWKYMVDDKLTIEDYLNDVEPFLRKIVDDPERLSAEDVDTFLPDFTRHYDALKNSAAYARMADELVRRVAAEHALVHSMDPMLSAMRGGLWETLGSRCVKAMTWRDAELRVCGLPYPNWEQFQASVKCALSAEHAAMFWAAMKTLTPQEWGAFFYFAAAQKRYPLTRKISVQPSGSSPDHMPVASTCFASVTVPAYKSVEDYTKKIKQAIACQDMELA